VDIERRRARIVVGPRAADRADQGRTGAAVSAPTIADALGTLARELPPALELLASELEAHAAAPTALAAIEMVPPSVFARDHSLHTTTVRQMAKDGRIEAVRIGKRQWRVRRDSPIQPIRREERATSGRELAIERARQLAAKLDEWPARVAASAPA
jgi:hypothetical protein